MLSFYMTMLSDSGDRNEFTELYMHYRSMMYNASYKILRDEGLSEDAVHNAFLRVIKYFDKVRGGSDTKVRNLLYIIARNEAIRIYHKRRDIPDDDIIEDIPDDTSVAEIVENRDITQKIFSTIKTMDKKYGDVLMLKFYYHYTDAEIAELLGISLENAKIRVHRGREKLKKILGKDGEQNE